VNKPKVNLGKIQAKEWGRITVDNVDCPEKRKEK